jgi:hypothetical protein
MEVCVLGKLIHIFKYVIKYTRIPHFDQKPYNKNAQHIRLWQVSAQAPTQNMQMAMAFCAK